jgi:hypothetical protein
VARLGRAARVQAVGVFSLAVLRCSVSNSL